jgi:Fungal protein kinase
LHWSDVQALIEHTRENKPPMRMPATVVSKNYQVFCSQPERDFIINLCITGEGFHIVVADHSGVVETDVIKITHSTTLLFIRMIMGLTFLPDNYLGVDTTIVRRDLGISSGEKFNDTYPPHVCKSTSRPTFSRDSVSDMYMNPLAITTYPATEGFDKHLSTITICNTVYKVIRVIFLAKSFIGRATRVFLVQCPNGSMAVLKDSWIPVTRAPESKFLEGLVIPFGPEIIHHDILRNTGTLRAHAVQSSGLDERREKRRIVIYPAGVHIADFSSLWELLVAFLDIVVGM